MILRSLAALACAACLVTTGCASSVARWIVETRDRQGETALAAGNYADALTAYELALKVDPQDPVARAGLAKVQIGLAHEYFVASKFENALTALAVAEKYAPQDVRIANLRDQVQQARLQREIVLTNFPAYSDSIAQLRRAYDGLRARDAVILAELKAFNYTFDTNRLHDAIQRSYELNREVIAYTNRLQAFRQLVESGTPANTGAKSDLAPPASLLPLP